MKLAERGFVTGRFVAVLVVSSFAIALAGCGGDDGSATTGAATSGTSSTTPTAVPDQVSPGTGTTAGGSGGTTGGSPTSTPPTSTPPTTTPPTTTPPTSTPPPATSGTSVTLGWQPPTQNTNGTPITDLAGYKIHYGTASSDYTQTVAVQNAGLTRYVVDNLPSGTYYFAITAYNSKGVESPLSGELSTAVAN